MSDKTISNERLAHFTACEHHDLDCCPLEFEVQSMACELAALRVENTQLRQQVDNLASGAALAGMRAERDLMQQEAAQALAREKRLREALERIRTLHEGEHHTNGFSACYDIAEAALNEKGHRP